MSIQKLRSGRVPTATASTYIGEGGTIFWNEATGELRLSNGTTPGGLPIPITIATTGTAGSVKPGLGLKVDIEGTMAIDASSSFAFAGNKFSLLAATTTRVGGIKAGPGVVIANDGTLTIDSTGLSFSFGDFYATTLDNGDAAISSIQENQNIDIISNGTGMVNIVGELHVHATDSTTIDALAAEPIFKVSGDGQIRMLVPHADTVAGALEIIGNTLGDSFSPNQTGVILHVTGNQNSIARNYFDANNNYALITGRRYNGSLQAATAVLNNETILRIAAQGSVADGTFNPFGPSRISFYANELQTSTAQGGRIGFEVTKNGFPADSTGTNTITVASMDAQNGLTAIRFNGPLTGNVTGNVSGNAGTVTNGVYTSDTGTVTNTMLAGSIANNKLANSSITVNGSSIALGGSATVTAAAGTLTGTTLNATVVTSSLTSVGTLANLNVTGAIVAGSFSGKLYRGVRDAGTIADGGTLTIDFSTDAIVYCVWGNGMTLAYQNYTAGAVVRVMAVKTTGTGTDSINLDGITASHVSTGNTTVAATADTTVFMEFTCTGTTIGSLFLKV